MDPPTVQFTTRFELQAVLALSLKLLRQAQNISVKEKAVQAATRAFVDDVRELMIPELHRY